MAARWNVVRKAPYTEIGVRRLCCIRCGAQASFQWQICSDGNNYRPLCTECDVALNRMVLEWMRHPNAVALGDAYATSKGIGAPSDNGERWVLGP